MIGTCAQVRVKTESHPAIAATIVATDAPDDLAILKADEPLTAMTPATIRVSDEFGQAMPSSSPAIRSTVSWAPI